MRLFSICLIILFTLTGYSQTASKPVVTSTFSSKQWMELSQERRVGFLMGLADCSIFDLGDRRLSRFSGIFEEPILMKRLESDANLREKEIETVVIDLFSDTKSPLPPPSPNGERHKGKHGFFNGEYWRQASPIYRIGFIQGYLYCSKKHLSIATRFTKTPEWYALKISNWYGLDSENDDDIDDSKANISIADVLYKFINKDEIKTNKSE